MPTIEELLMGMPLEKKIEPEKVIEVVKDTLQEDVLSVEEAAEVLKGRVLPTDLEVIEEQLAQDEGAPTYVMGVDAAGGESESAITVVLQDSEGELSVVLDVDIPVDALRKSVKDGSMSPEQAILELKKLDFANTIPFEVAQEFVALKGRHPLDAEVLKQADEEVQKNNVALKLLKGEAAHHGIQELQRLAEAKKEPEPQSITISGTTEPASSDYQTLDLNDIGVEVQVSETAKEPEKEVPFEELSDADQLKSLFTGKEAPTKPYDPSVTASDLVEEVGFEEPKTPPIPDSYPSADPIVEEVGFDAPLSFESEAPKVAYDLVDTVHLKNKRVVLIDGSNMAMRCFFPLKDMCRSDGRRTGLLYGMLKSIRAIQRDCNALPLLVWDGGGSTKKRKVYADYKGNRKESEIKTMCFGELKNVREWLRYLGVPQAWKQGEEADDVIGTLASKTFKDDRVFIYSSDDDFLQLVDDAHCTVVKPSKDGPVFYDSEKVKERLGVPPSLVPMFRCLRGDKSDNLPGIPNFQSKKIVELVTAHNTVEELFSNPEVNFKSLTPKSREKISVFREQAEINLQLMILDPDLEPEIQATDFDARSLRSLFEEMEFNSYLDVFEEWERDSAEAPALRR